MKRDTTHLTVRLGFVAVAEAVCAEYRDSLAGQRGLKRFMTPELQHKQVVNERSMMRKLCRMRQARNVTNGLSLWTFNVEIGKLLEPKKPVAEVLTGLLTWRLLKYYWIKACQDGRSLDFPASQLSQV